MTHDVWAVCPTAEPTKCAETFERWRDMGYRTAALVDGAGPDVLNADMTIHVDPYRGYAASINTLCQRIGLAPDWIVATAADTYPDPRVRASVIAAECREHFRGTYGICQPFGDRYGCQEPNPPTGINSPWMGSEFRRRIYQGHGPYPDYYVHWFDDTELAEVVLKLGLLWLRPDLTQYHDHWSRNQSQSPPHMANKTPRWQEMRNIYLQRKAAGYPGHEPLPE